jgi:hypothetical protein
VRRERVLAAAALLLGACTLRSPIREAVTVDLTQSRDVASVLVTTDIDDGAGSDRPEKTNRLEELRREISGGSDPWSMRFSSVEKLTDRVAMENRRGALVRYERGATLARRDLQRMFADTGLVLQFNRGEGWTELSIYANSSGRATRQQRERVLSVLNQWSTEVAAYLRAMHDVYEYLEREPDRATAMFAALVENDDEIPVARERELIERVDATTKSLTTLMDEAEQRGVSIDEQFDLVFNPFPAAFTVRTPPILSFEGFTKKGDALVAERAGLLEAVLALENRWLSPDPLAMLVRADVDGKEFAAKDIAALPRKSSSTVTAQEIASAVTAILQRGGTYRVRFTER